MAHEFVLSLGMAVFSFLFFFCFLSFLKALKQLKPVLNEPIQPVFVADKVA